MLCLELSHRVFDVLASKADRLRRNLKDSTPTTGVSSFFTSPPDDLQTLVADGVKELEKLARIQTGSSIGDNVEAFRQAIFNKIGFNSTLFELARAVRDLKAITGKLSTAQQQQYIDRFRMWASKLAA